jgi:uncharacterized protein (TIGR02246 family)
MDAEEILQAMMRAWDRGDSRAHGDLFAADAVFIDLLGRVQAGRSVIANEHRKIFDTIYRDSRWSGHIELSRDLGHGVAVINTASELFVPHGLRAGTLYARQTMVLVHGLIAYFHNTERTSMSEFARDDPALAALGPLGWQRD